MPPNREIPPFHCMLLNNRRVHSLQWCRRKISDKIHERDGWPIGQPSEPIYHYEVLQRQQTMAKIASSHHHHRLQPLHRSHLQHTHQSLESASPQRDYRNWTREKCISVAIWNFKKKDDYPGILWLAPFVDVPAAIFPCESIAIIPIVSWFELLNSRLDNGMLWTLFASIGSYGPQNRSGSGWTF